MAALTFQAVNEKSGKITVTRSTDDAIGSATAALIIDSTATWYAVHKAVRGLNRALRRMNMTDSKPSAIATSGASVE